jgi:general secretion pathway protein E
MRRISLIEALKEAAELPEERFSEISQMAQESGGLDAHLLVKKKLITESQLLSAWSLQYGLPYREELPLEHINTDFADTVPIHFLKKSLLVPLQLTASSGDKGGSRNLIAIHDPADFQPMDDLVAILGLTDFQVVLARKDAILSAINLFYDLRRDSAEQLVQDMAEDSRTIISEITDTEDLLDDTSDAPIIKLVNHILSQAIKSRASDIHIEPSQTGFKVRYRVDGILYDTLTPPKWIQASLISRIKIMAKLNIAEKRLPQDGRLEVRVGDQEIDVRVSTIPISFGERVVLRLLNKTTTVLQLPELGPSPEKLKQLRRLVKSPNGIILVTGPTGSGKTTSLYAVLSSINTPDINIITIEDPVEYQLNGISQIQVNPKIDLTFARGLRSIVRQDPDVILIGEIRDMETAEIAVQSALTGHLVFSTLHTNDSASAITRLVDIGVEPFLIASSVIAVVAQRLVRVLCSACKAPYVPDVEALESIGLPRDRFSGQTVYQAVGCDKCLNSGYRGRIGIFEILELNNRMKSLLISAHDATRIKEEAMKHHMTTLRDDGLDKVLQGVTTIEEVLRVTHA